MKAGKADWVGQAGRLKMNATVLGQNFFSLRETGLLTGGRPIHVSKGNLLYVKSADFRCKSHL